MLKIECRKMLMKRKTKRLSSIAGWLSTTSSQTDNSCVKMLSFLRGCFLNGVDRVGIYSA